MLRRLDQVCPWWGPLACLDCSSVDQRPDTTNYRGDVAAPVHSAARVPATLRRLLKGLQSLGRARVLSRPQGVEYVVVSGSSLRPDPGPWCVDAPIWGNPFLAVPNRSYNNGPRGLQVLPRTRYINPRQSGGGLVRPALQSVGDVVRAIRVVRPLAARDPYRGPWADGDSEVDDLNMLVAALPPGWCQAVEAATPSTPGPLQTYQQSDGLSGRAFERPPTQQELKVEADMVACMGWKMGRRVPVTLGGLTVKLGTELQLRPLYSLRNSYQVGFVDEFAPLLDLCVSSRVSACVALGLVACQQVGTIISGTVL